MTLRFPVELIINGDEWKIQPFRFDVHAINTGTYTPSYRDVTVTGVSPLNLPNAEANGLKTIKLFGKAEQTPNLFDKDKATLNYYINSSGEEQYNASWACTDYIEVTAGKPYNLSGVTSYGSSPRTGFYAADKSFVSARLQSSSNFTIPDGVKYMRMSIYKTSINTAVIKQVLSMDNPIPILCNNGAVGSTGYTVVGSPTISSDLVVSGFSDTSYIKTQSLPSLLGQANSWEIDLSFTTPSDVSNIIGVLFEGNSNWCQILRIGKTGHPTIMQLSLTSTGNSYDIASYKDIVYVTADTTYWVKIIFTGTEYLCKYSTDNINFTTVNVATSSAKIKDNSTALNVGINKNANPAVAFKGTIDLKEFKITVDGVPVRLPELVQIFGKNLFDQSQLLKATDWSLTDGWYTGLFSNFNTQFTNGFEIDVPFKEKTVYTFNCRGYVSDEGSRARFIFVYTDESTKSLTIDSTTATTYTLTTPSTKTLAKIRGSYASGAGSTLYLKDIQLEEGSSATNFQPYHASPTAVARDLLSCGDDYVDEQNITTGEITRKVGYKVLTGTENWTSAAGTPSSGYAYALTNNHLQESTYLPLCSHFKAVQGDTAVTSMNTGDFKCSSADNSLILVSDQTTAENFKTWLAAQNTAGTPVIVVYPLTTSTAETVAAQDTLQNVEGLNTLYITQSAIDGLSMEVTYSAGVEVTIEAVQSANVDQTVEVTIGE